jgi:hypothetical protein
MERKKEMIPLREILERVEANRWNGPKSWKEAANDATFLALQVKYLVGRIHELNEYAVKEKKDLCKLCAGYTWGRPLIKDGMDFESDYTRRQCSNCGEIRPEPEGELRWS